ncbi:hypothetical protein HGRIS_010230 [Hohenbuehelia grisea]|uniref:Uncharacterized protein n=1 Tax=Hohenbuehelia grisea TaxID=104357 RepID=A0ABR3J4A2_9AGAR
MKFALAPLAALVAAMFVNASPVAVISQGPTGLTKILTPNHSFKWEVGTVQTVSWIWDRDPSSPDYTADRRAAIWLSKNGEVQYDHLLAGPFSKWYAPESHGSQTVTVPDVRPGLYSITLEGFNATKSQEFLIFRNSRH